MATEPAFNPVLLDIPDQFATERLLIRAPRPGDGAVLFASVVETIDDLRRYPSSMPWAMEEQTPARTEEYARRGAASWIIRADFPMFAFAHLGARRVWCGADEENARSWRVAERLGFEHEGTLKSERCDPDGTRRTMRIYATTR